MVPREVTDPPHQAIFSLQKEGSSQSQFIPTSQMHFRPLYWFSDLFRADCCAPCAWLALSASLTPQTRNFAHPGELHTQRGAKVVQHLGDSVSVWHLNLNVQMSPFWKSVWYYYWKQVMTSSIRAHPATSLPFPNGLSWQEISTAGVKKAEHLPDAANQHLALNITSSEGTCPGLHTVFCEGLDVLYLWTSIMK